MSARGGKIRRKPVSKSRRAGLVFPVSRVARFFRGVIHNRMLIGSAAPVYITSVLEYLTAEVLELAGNSARDHCKKRITPRHIMLALAFDEELHKLFKGVTLPSTGVLPHVHLELVCPELLHPKRQYPTAVTTPPPPKASRQKAQPTAKKATVKKSTIKRKASTAAKAKAPKKAKKASKSVKASANSGVKSTTASMNSGSTSDGITILSEKTLFLGQKLTVIQGDIIQMKVDAIIHPTNQSLSYSGQIGNELQKAGGKEFEQEANALLASIGKLNTADAAICPGHNFPARFVIHVNSPTWKSQNSIAQLETAVNNILKLADDKQLKIIAIPSISSGNAGFPKQAAAQTILRAISAYFKSVTTSTLLQIFFVLYDMESIGIYTSELAKLDS